VSDIHGSYKALTQVLDRADFNKEEDALISLGDVCDGWPDVTECVTFLSELPEHTHLLGNHDDWCLRWLESRIDPMVTGLSHDEHDLWYSQGGRATLDSLRANDSHILIRDYLRNALPYFEIGNDLFVHGGIPKWVTNLDEVDLHTFIWDRSMVVDAIRASAGELIRENYVNVYCGHTPTILLNVYTSDVPIHKSNVWMLDTGASYDGKLSVMCLETKEVWQSDKVMELYPGKRAR